MYKLKLSQKIAYAGMLAALAVALNLVSMRLPGFTISFFYIPCFLAGIILGPVYGLSVGFVGDLLGTILPGLSPSPLILLGKSLIGAIMGGVFWYVKNKNELLKIIAGAVLVLIIVTMGLNSYALTLPPINQYASYEIAVGTRIVFQPLILAINTMLTFLLHIALKRTFFKTRAGK